MPKLRVALAQLDPVVGDIAGNANLVLDAARRAHAAGAGIVAVGEMFLTGYPAEDLLYRDSFADASRAELARLATRLRAEGLGEIAVVTGYYDLDGPLTRGPDDGTGGGPRNAAALLYDGQVVTKYFKHYLPNYGVFDEDRYFNRGDRLPIIRLGLPDGDVDLAIVICEDMWATGGPVTAAGEAGVNLVLSINASPYEQTKSDGRLELCQRRAREAGAPLAYVNILGGQDELVFDGDSLVVDAHGELLARAAQFAEELLVVDLDLEPARSTVDGELAAMAVERLRLELPAVPPITSPALVRVAERLSADGEVWSALVLGLQDYIKKNGFRSVVLGLSGGIDSSIVAAIAADAIGPANVVGVSMPTKYSSDHSQSDAADLAKRIGLDFRIVPIAGFVEAINGELGFTGLAEENLQARLRGAIVLMGLSNSEGHLVLTTGNKSELAMGYSTLYGDSCGGFNPIKDVLKTTVWRLSRWRNEEAVRRGQTPPIPENAISKPPSAELRPGQLDTDSLPPYEQLDAILSGYVDGDLGRADLLAAGHDPAIVDRVVRSVDLAEYKRRQSAPGPKITGKAFGRDRRLPMTNGWREHG
ncbi:NAD+ synthase [Fodinicola feengrottensis]|uniref:Glutamine-dependent NAD(+) synthetase n=1 Tax=Fodinicola feengrottensis TaxID=435914 RepID=A0ABN2G575_9ACTN